MPLIPINTDAPLYHFPYTTIGLIVVNIICFAATGFALNDRLLEPWLLQYGDGLNPLEWIPAAFAHGGVMHLIGNMFFLWGFGLVDCEKWDLFSVLSGKYGRFAEADWAIGGHSPTGRTYGELPLPTGTEESADGASTAKRAIKSSNAMKHVNALIDSGDVLTAAEELMAMRLRETDICPDEARMRTLAMGLLQAQAFDDAEIWLQEYIDHYPDDNSWARIRMAQLLLTQFKRPTAALRTLKGLALAGVNAQMQTLAKKIVRTAKEQILSGVQDEEPEW